MKNIIKKTMIFGVITLLIGGLALISDLVTVFNFNPMEYIKSNWVLFLLGYILLVLGSFTVQLCLEYYRLFKNDSTSEVESLIEKVEKLQNQLDKQKSLTTSAQTTANILSNELDSINDSEGLYNPFNIDRQIIAVNKIIDLVADLKKDILEVVKYNTTKTKHRKSFERYKIEYVREIVHFEENFHKYLEKQRYNVELTPRILFEKATFDTVLKEIIGDKESFYSELQKNKTLNYIDKIEQPLLKYCNYIENKKYNSS